MRVAAVKLVKSVRVLLPCSSVVSVEVDGVEGDVLLEPLQKSGQTEMRSPLFIQ